MQSGERATAPVAAAGSEGFLLAFLPMGSAKKADVARLFAAAERRLAVGDFRGVEKYANALQPLAALLEQSGIDPERFPRRLLCHE